MVTTSYIRLGDTIIGEEPARLLLRTHDSARFAFGRTAAKFNEEVCLSSLSQLEETNGDDLRRSYTQKSCEEPDKISLPTRGSPVRIWFPAPLL